MPVKRSQMNVVQLKPAESPAKVQMINLLRELRAKVEADEIISLVTISVLTDGEWENKSAGEVRAREMIGYLHCAIADFVEVTKR